MTRFRPWHPVAFAAILAMNACGGDGGTGPPPPPPEPANRAPQAVGTLDEMTIPVNLAVTVQVASRFRDPDGDALTFSASSSNTAVVSVTATGSSIEVTGVAPGTATVTVTARDPDGLTASLDMAVTVNAPPVVSDTIPAQTLARGDTVTLALQDYFSDPDGDMLSYEATTSDVAVATVSTTDSTATIVGVGAGAATLTFTVIDPYGEMATQEAGVTVEQANQAPRATDAIPAQALMPDGSATIDLSSHFSDPDDDELTYEGATSDPAVATVSIDGANATIAGVAGGTATITFTATDPEGLSATQNAAVTVNTPPAPQGTIDAVTVAVDEATPLVVSSYFTDADGDALSYEAASSDDGIATASAADSTVTIEGVAAGSATITITATDPHGASATQEATVAVKTAPMPDSLPPTHDMVVGNHVELDFSTFFTDEDGDDLTYTATTSDATVATASVNGSVVTTAAADEIDDSVGVVVTLTVTATDPAGLSAQQEAMVRVNAMEYDTLSGISVNENGEVTVPVLGVLGNCFTVPPNFPFPPQLLTVHWSEWQLATGTGWVTAPRTYRDGTVSPTNPYGHNICPVKDWQDRQAGTYRLVGRLTILTQTDTTDANLPVYGDTVTATLRSPTYTNKPGGDAANGASFGSLEAGGVGGDQGGRASVGAAVGRGAGLGGVLAAGGWGVGGVGRVRASAQAALRRAVFTRSRGVGGWRGRLPGNQWTPG